MSDQLIVWVSEGILLLFLVIAFVVVLAASIYDIRLTMQRKSLQKTRAKLRGIHRPTISVLVYARNSSNSIKNCLSAIKRNRYSRCDVVVIDDLSTDDTRRIIRSFNEKYPLFSLRLYSSRIHRDRRDTYLQGYRRSQKGDLVLIIDASSIIPSKLLKDSAARFVSDEKLRALHFNIYNTSLHSITLLYYRFRQLSGSLFSKFYSLISKYKMKTLESGTMYRRSAFRNICKTHFVLGKYDGGLIVADDLISNDMTAVSRLAAQSASNRLSYLAIVIGALFLQTYSVYAAATLQSRTLFMVGWLAIALWLLLAVWSSEALNIDSKIKLTFFAPIIYFLVYVHLILYVISAMVVAASMLGRFTFSVIFSRFSS